MKPVTQKKDIIMVATPLKDMAGQLADHLRQNAASGQTAVFRADPGSVLLSANDLRAMNRGGFAGAAFPQQEALAGALAFLSGRGR